GSLPSHMLNGNQDATPDYLRLEAADNIVISGTVGGDDALEGLTIGGVTVGSEVNLPNNVTFYGPVTVNGDLQITASGVVTFYSDVVLTSGKLVIQGASQVIFKGGVVVQGGGDIVLQGDEIDFQGGDESIVGTGKLWLRPTTTSLNIEVGSPINSVTNATLNINDQEVRKLADGFSTIVIGGYDSSTGHATGTGTVRIAALTTAGQPLLRDNLEVYGQNITVEDANLANQTLLVEGTVKLDAIGNIRIGNTMEARTAAGVQDIVLYSATGSVQQFDAAADGATGEALIGGRLTVTAASGINLGATQLDSVSATHTGTLGDITIRETAAGGDLTVLGVAQTQAGASGNIGVATTAG
ncbi:hypothetical protein, partial [Pseudacidovorax intermedius]|uniref:hypothetical protein n=1 Tax=Pseudacidovorax intermedius TaxID=433924 RepID=UPI0005BCF734